ncbi:uncharacterized protein LOC123554225 [Mercenaria mercenaria]|uniref:uncharacterized protein LOC123554225 n=1 Tax=Mercenaria mercenaria TaxID=6596 RepID=UPI00234EBE51|nr:uncharacterized protein LOC123554225 [Mercenaria mercenaria]
MDRVCLIAAIVFLGTCFGTAEAKCVKRSCNPEDDKPCPDCYFCKQDYYGNYFCLWVNEGNVVDLDDLKAIIQNFESLTLTTVDGNPDPDVNDPVIGYGFNLNRADAAATFNAVLGSGVDFNKVRNGEQGITLEQANALFDHDIDNIYIPRAENSIGEALYDSLTYNRKVAIVNAFYRGDIGPTTITLIKEKRWDDACEDYLDSEEYRNSAQNIRKRMECNARQFCPPEPKPCKMD